jgi:hypothetical protein
VADLAACLPQLAARMVAVGCVQLHRTVARRVNGDYELVLASSPCLREILSPGSCLNSGAVIMVMLRGPSGQRTHTESETDTLAPSPRRSRRRFGHAD